MKLILFYAALGYILAICVCVKALECGLSEGPDHETIRRIASQCTKNNGNNNSHNNNNGSNNSEENNSNSRENESDESNESTTTTSPKRPLKPRNSGRNQDRQSSNSNNSPSSNSHGKEGNSHNGRNQNGHSNNNNNNNNYGNNNYNNGNNNNYSNKTQNCDIISCILGQLHMIDKYGYPDRNMVSQALTKSVRSNELRDFLQESTDDCFEILDAEQKSEQCEYSTHLINCLADKGRNHCDDWHDQNFPF